MKPALSVAVATALSVSAFGQTPLPRPQLLRTQTAFDLTVPLPCAEAAPLFGPECERAWAGEHWDPKFIYPQPAHDEQGAVFTIQRGPITATWVNNLFDLQGRHFQYTYFMPGIMVTTIDVRFTPTNAANTQVHVVYTRTALTPEGNEHVATLTSNDQSAAHDWQQAIDSYLSSLRH